MNDPYQQTAPKQINTATMKPHIFLLVIFLIAQLIGTILYGIYLHMKLDKVEEDMGLYEDYVFIRRLKKCMKGDNEGTLLNCKEIVSQFQKLLLEVTSIKTTDTVTLSMLKEDMKHPIAAHVYGQQSNGQKTALQWAKVGYSTLSHLTYEKDALKVERPGLYYVYSQVTFCVNGSSTSAAPFVHYMYLKHPHESDKLLLRGTSAHNGLRTSDCTQQSIYLGGIFDFQKGEAIFVNVTDSTQVRYMAGYTYFGMFMI
ncbi:CD40 ligand [Lissotriton helveticus]